MHERSSPRYSDRLNAFILNLSEAFSPAPWPGRAFFAAIVISDGERQVGRCGGGGTFVISRKETPARQCCHRRVSRSATAPQRHPT
jgi:hypothetical protein